MRHVVAFMILVALLAAGGLFGARNYSGEVVTLYTTDAGDRVFETSLWVVEDRHKLWIRSINPTSQWLDRLIQNPEIRIKRGGVMTNYRATPLTHRRERINSLIADRYGWGEWLLTKFAGRETAVPVLLNPFV